MNTLQTPLYHWHLAHQARMIEFAGWSMPIQYTSLIHEHETTRTRVGLTDVSHMGRFILEGNEAAAFLDSVTTRNVIGMKSKQVRYSLLTNQHGGIKDDLLIARLPSPEHWKKNAAETPESKLIDSKDKEARFLIVVNAANHQKDWNCFKDAQKIWETSHPPLHRLEDVTLQTGMIAVQGPLSCDILVPILSEQLAEMRYYSAIETIFDGETIIVTRTGYTGEDGFEIVASPTVTAKLFDLLFETGKHLGVEPVGLGARDTLRLEAGMPLYGHELDEITNPFEAGLKYAVCLDGNDFPGRDALRALSHVEPKRVRVGLEIKGKRPAREGYSIFCRDEQIGHITSGTVSPTLKKPIAMGYLPPLFAEIGETVLVDIRGTKTEAVIVPLPFYER
ncbi:MAG: glycine cleavage system aminomethyltransferase GcvT [Thermoguttaceae bacterium]